MRHSIYLQSFTDNIIILSDFYISNIVPGINGTPIISDIELLSELKSLSDNAFNSYLSEILLGLSPAERLELLNQFEINPNNLPTVEEFHNALVKKHTEIPVEGESLVMKKTRNIPQISMLFENNPGLVFFLKQIHAMWCRR
jgi:hypothetical protein